MDAIGQRDIAAELERFIVEGGRAAGADVVLTQDTDLFESGILDSLGGVRLIGHIEERYGIVLLDEDVLGAGFSTIRGITAIVRARLADESIGRS